MGQAKQRGDYATRKAEGEQRKAEALAASKAQQDAWQAQRDQQAENLRQAKEYREAVARSLEPTNFHSGVAQHGVYEALVKGFQAVEQQAQQQDTE